MKLALLALFLFSPLALACPDYSGQYQKIEGSDEYSDNIEEREQYVHFPLKSFSVTSTNCEAVVTGRSGLQHHLQYQAEKNAYVGTKDVGFYRFILSLQKKESGQLRVIYSRTRNFMEGTAPVYSHYSLYK